MSATQSHPFVRPGQIAPHLPAPDNCMRCGQPERDHVSAELAARRTAAAAVVADYEAALKATNDARRIHWADWASRMAAELRSVLAQLDAEQAKAAEPSQLVAIRALLAAFDWEHDDRQLALERIEAIAFGDGR